MILRLLCLSILLSLCGNSSHAVSDATEDLHWYQRALEFTKLSSDGLQRHMDPRQGPASFRLNEQNAPWAGNYFPMNAGGIANRWLTGSQPNQLLTANQLDTMSTADQQKLSPVEKYDILMGFYDFRTTNHELQERGPLREGAPPQEWEGFCNGVRCAGVLLPEPLNAIEKVNPHGIVVRFEPADLKALAGASYFYTQNYAQIGSPTREATAENQPNPAVFDMALRFGLAKHKKAFIIDSHLGDEIWNETVVGYQRTLSENTALTENERARYPGAIAKMDVRLILETLGEIAIAASNRPTTAGVASGALLEKVNTGYTLFLDKNNQAIDGQWHPSSGTRGVDFAWFTSGRGADRKYTHLGGNPFLRFGKINRLVRESAKPFQCRKIFR